MYSGHPREVRGPQAMSSSVCREGGSRATLGDIWGRSLMLRIEPNYGTISQGLWEMFKI